jgi:hypothetical protein
MPFGRKPDLLGKLIDFDAVYSDLIAPSVEAAGLEPIRADEEMTGGIIHKPMFERLILCDYAVADLTTANANVFYELGVRHAVKKATTVLLFAKGRGQLPFDVRSLRAFPYQLGEEGKPAGVEADRASLTKRLLEARNPTVDSPIYQLVEGFPDIQHLKTDVFRDRVEYSNRIKRKLAGARATGIPAIHAIENEITPIEDAEAGVVIDLFLSYRDAKAWKDMIRLVELMAPPLSNTVMVREQLALALNRNGDTDEAERTLLDLIAERGSSSETCGILGRVYKDRWLAAAEKPGSEALAQGLLDKAIMAYLKGFEADSRDFYPGINAVTLMELKDPPDPQRLRLIPVVSYAVDQQIAAGKANYWDYATRLELAVLAKDKAVALETLCHALAARNPLWERETTVNNLRMIRRVRERRNEGVPWAADIENELLKGTCG